MTPPQALFSTIAFKNDLSEKIRLLSILAKTPDDISCVVWHSVYDYRATTPCMRGCKGVGYKRWGFDLVTCNRCYLTWRLIASAILEEKRKRAIGRNDYDPEDYCLPKIMGARKEIHYTRDDEMF